MTEDTDVLIVGAGPTGLALAATLKRRGINSVIVDKLVGGQNTSRAAVIHAHTLEVLDSLGISERLMEEGLRLAKFSIRDRDSVLACLRFDALPSRFSCLLMLPQDKTESVLREALAGAHGEVQWGWAVDRLEATHQGVIAMLASSEGRRTIRARYVVGADGMHSVVRQSAGIGFTGSSYEESFVLADIDMQWDHGRDEVMLFFSPGGVLVVAPLPGGRVRIVATLDEAPPQLGIAEVQALLDTRGPTRGAAKVSHVHWSSRFRLHHRVADHYRKGSLFLVGDAAHVHSPAGGQGMNTGLIDACVLGRSLADVISGKKDDSALDAYEELRRPAAQQVLALAGTLTKMATLRSAPQRMLRNLFLRTVARLPLWRRRMAMNLSGLSRRTLAVTPD